MKCTPISDDIRRYILINIPSIPYLEAILLLKADSEHHWSINEVAKRLFINDKDAADLLVQLQNAGIIIPANQEPLLYQFQPQTDELKKIIDDLAKTYAANLIEVTNLIHSNSNTNKKAQKFANAFIWRKDS